MRTEGSIIMGTSRKQWSSSGEIVRSSTSGGSREGVSDAGEQICGGQQRVAVSVTLARVWRTQPSSLTRSYSALSSNIASSNTPKGHTNRARGASPFSMSVYMGVAGPVGVVACNSLDTSLERRLDGVVDMVSPS